MTALSPRRFLALVGLIAAAWLGSAGCGDTLVEPLVVVDGGASSLCAPPATPCGGPCFDLSTSNTHCGACDVACGGGAHCEAGSCVCPEGQTKCDGVCTSLDVDPQNCGACGNQCGSDDACHDGDCEHGCEPPKIECGDACVDLDQDPEHCGDCGKKCESGKACVEGLCS